MTMFQVRVHRVPGVNVLSPGLGAADDLPPGEQTVGGLHRQVTLIIAIFCANISAQVCAEPPPCHHQLPPLDGGAARL